MTTTRSVLLSIAICCLSGCYNYIPVDVYVVDWETREPISDADAAISYAWPLTLPPFPSPPKYSEGLTNASGYTRLRIADTKRESALIGVYHKHYHSASRLLIPNRHTPTNRIHVENVELSDDRVTIHLSLMHESIGDVLLVVPKGYRGLVRIHHAVDASAPLPRNTPFDLSLDGIVRVIAPPEASGVSYDYMAEWSDGTLIPGPWSINGDKYNDTIAFRYVYDNLFMIGTEKDVEMIENQLYIATDNRGAREFDHEAYQRILNGLQN